MSRRASGAVTRRELLVAGGAATAVGMAGVVEGAAAHPHHDADSLAPTENWLFGTVERVEGADSLVIKHRQGQGLEPVSVHVELQSDAQVLRDGRARLTDFLVGEEITVAGAFEGTEFKATQVEASYRIAASTVVSDDNSQRIVTADDVVVNITPKTEARGGGALGHTLEPEDPRALDGGDAIVVMGRRVPFSDNTLNGNLVGVIED